MKGPHIFHWLLASAAAVPLFFAIWIVAPAPHMLLLPLGVGVPELSPFFLVASLVVGAMALRAGAGRLDRLAVIFSLIAAILCALPLAQFPGVVGRFDRLLPVERTSAARPPLSARDFILGIDTGEPPIVRGIEFARPDGESLTVDIYRPPSSSGAPILVQIYGGAWQRGAPGDNGAFARHFASRGYLVFAIDYRHAPRWQWPAQIEDVRTALAWVRGHAREYGGDTGRVALIGRSAGAQLALIAAYEMGTPAVAGVVSYYGPTDLAEGWRVPPRPDPLNVRGVLEAYLGGTPDQVPARYREASPVTYVSQASAVSHQPSGTSDANATRLPPTLLIYGTRDHIVEARFGRDLHARLQAAGASSVLLEIPWAEHAFDVLLSGLGGQLSLAYTERFLANAMR